MGLRPFYKQINRLGTSKGQSIIFVLLVLLVLVCFIALVVNVGQKIQAKVKSQNAADASVYSGMIWYSRGLNIIAAGNQLVAFTYVLIALAITIAIVLIVACVVITILTYGGGSPLVCDWATRYIEKLPKILNFLTSFGKGVNEVQAVVKDVAPIIGHAEALRIGFMNMNNQKILSIDPMDPQFSELLKQGGIVIPYSPIEQEGYKLPVKESSVCEAITLSDKKIKELILEAIKGLVMIPPEIMEFLTPPTISCKDGELDIDATASETGTKEDLGDCSDSFSGKDVPKSYGSWDEFEWVYKRYVKREDCDCTWVSEKGGGHYECECDASSDFVYDGTDSCRFYDGDTNEAFCSGGDFCDEVCDQISPNSAPSSKQVKNEIECWDGSECDEIIKWEFDSCHISKTLTADEFMGNPETGADVNQEKLPIVYLLDKNFGDCWMLGLGIKGDADPILLKDLFKEGKYTSPWEKEPQHVSSCSAEMPFYFALSRAVPFCKDKAEEYKEGDMLWDMCWTASLVPVIPNEQGEKEVDELKKKAPADISLPEIIGEIILH